MRIYGLPSVSYSNSFLDLFHRALCLGPAVPGCFKRHQGNDGAQCPSWSWIGWVDPVEYYEVDRNWGEGITLDLRKYVSPTVMTVTDKILDI
jgi:hypothetical protein